jgi:hypothetical protein
MQPSASDPFLKFIELSQGHKDKNEPPAGTKLGTLQSYMIFGVGQDPARISVFTSWAADNRIGIKALVGKYEGRVDHCFIAQHKHFTRIKPFLQKEESILVLDRFDAHGIPHARLLYHDGCEEEKGILQLIPQEDALRSPSWTLDPMNGNYFKTGDLT